ncbi:MAG: Glucosaminate ammonia-lyase [Candidatus Anoxychlamydiales bacterium]|nr:Glucosaminate ammonia-lyase [Candidatus Anoxychlamydiales bacterium]
MKKFILKFLFSIFFTFSAFNFSYAKLPSSHREVQEVQEVVILGGGIGALTSGIYLSRAGYKPLIIEGEVKGGLITQSHSVENWPGEVKINGVDLSDKIANQALKNGCRFLSKKVINVDFSKKPYKIVLQDLYNKNDTEVIYSNFCIIAMGTSSNYLNVPGEQTYWGKGVSNCATCDGSLYKNKNVAIIGGGDAAITEAMYLSNIAKKAYVIVRKDALKASEKQRIEEIKKRKNVEFLYNTTVSSIEGNRENLTHINIKHASQIKELKIDGLFLAIGSTPNSEIFKNKLDLDRRGYIAVSKEFETSKKGIYAIGDIVDPKYKQAITAAGDGAKAAMNTISYLEKYQKPKVILTKTENKKIENVNITSNATIIEIHSLKQFEKEISSANTPIIVDFYATWCGPCKRISPYLSSFSKSVDKKVKVLKVNVDKNKELASKYNITGMPTVIVFDKSSKMLFKKMGPNDISNLLNSIEKIKDKNTSEINSFLKTFK